MKTKDSKNMIKVQNESISESFFFLRTKQTKYYIFNGNNCLWFEIYKIKYSIAAIYYIFWVDSHTVHAGNQYHFHHNHFQIQMYIKNIPL